MTVRPLPTYPTSWIAPVALLATGALLTLGAAAASPAGTATGAAIMPLSGLSVAVLLSRGMRHSVWVFPLIGCTAYRMTPSLDQAAGELLAHVVVIACACRLFRDRHSVDDADSRPWSRDLLHVGLASFAGAVLASLLSVSPEGYQSSTSTVVHRAAAHLSGLVLFIPVGISVIGMSARRTASAVLRSGLWMAGFLAAAYTFDEFRAHVLVLGIAAGIAAGIRARRGAGVAWETVGITGAWLALGAAGMLSAQQEARLTSHILLLALISSALRVLINRSRLQERRLNALMNKTFDLIAEFSDEGRILFVNRGFQTLLGWDSRELIGADGWHLGHPDDHADAAAHLGDSSVVRTRLRCRDGGWKWVDSCQTEYRSPSGDLRRLAVARDVTAEVEYQEGLEAARREAEATSRAKSLFLANMSHEIRTPIASILGYIELLREDAEREAAHNGPLDSIQRNGRHLLALVNGVLDLSKIEADELSLQQVATSPAEIARDAVSIFAQIAQDKGISLELECDEDVPDWIESDPDRLRQILINLVGNATKFTDRGKVRLHLGRSPDESNRILYFSVTDTGPGIAEESLRTVFDPFVQADPSLSRATGGVGLGLAISLRLSQLLGGQIRASSQLGRGSEFLLEIPYEPIAAPPRCGIHLGDRPCEDLEVLVAEDSMDNQRLLRAFLRRAGAEVTLVSDGAQVVDEMRDRLGASIPPDLILMDIQMPELDGHEATRRIRSMGYEGPILALSAHATREDRERALAAGCDDYLTKPIDREVLISRVACFRTKSEGGREPA